MKQPYPKLLTLVENTSADDRCIAEHGLSVYVQTERHKLLVDTGQTDALVHNAAVLGVELSEVDTVILSHGHYDHAGGILPFCKRNAAARIYMQRTAAQPHFNGEREIGVDPAVFALPQVCLLDGDVQLDEELFLFCGVTGRRLFPPGNRTLEKVQNGLRVPDDFAHEQCLVLTHGGKRWLLSGCAHNGILNILDRYEALFGGSPDYVVSGFHLMKRDGTYTQEEKDLIAQTARALSRRNTVFFSGHCTGEAAFAAMREIMGEQLVALHTGEEIRPPD